MGGGDNLPCDIVTGGHWGDEGKGKIVAYLALNDKPEVIARGGVGPNAGHTVYVDGKKFGLRQIPCGFVAEKARILIGPGVLVNPELVLKELEETSLGNRLGIDKHCSIIEQVHIDEDKRSKHLKEKIGSTGTGCGPANVARVNRVAKIAEEIPEIAKYITDVPLEVNEVIKKGKYALIEGSQGFALSLTHGTYPFVTSKDTSASTLAADVGVGPTNVDNVIVVFKAYTTRVGEGPFPTEMSKEKAEEMGIIEHGTVTGRRRRIGDFDFEMAKRSVMINGATQLAITCIDRLFKGNEGVKKFKDLTSEAKEHIAKIEGKLGVPATLISTGPENDHIIDLRSEKLR